MKYLFLIILSAIGLRVQAQCVEIPLSLEARVELSDLVVEGKVISSEGFKSGNKIFTRYIIDPYVLFKGELKKQYEVIVEGGQVNDEEYVVYPRANIRSGDHGVFFLKSKETGLGTVAASQSLIRYDLNKAVDYHSSYTVDELRSVLSSLTKQNIFIKKYTWNSSGMRGTPIITDFFPKEIVAGKRQVLTIKGSGFGAERNGGSVSFKNADDGGASFIVISQDDYFQSWTDTEIKIYVPASGFTGVAGTGTFRVITATGTLPAVTIEKLAVKYGILELYNNGKILNADLIDLNFEGGYSFRLSEEIIQNRPASEAVRRVFENWRCNAGINFSIGYPTSISKGDGEGENIIIFDNENILDAGVLAQTTIYISGCTYKGQSERFATDMDITIRKDINWNYSADKPSFNQYDFESVILHEVGHALLLKHVIDVNKVMHFSLSPGDTERILSEDSEIPGAKDVLALSTDIANFCNFRNMIPVPAGLCAFEDAKNNNEDMVAYPNPSNGRFDLNIDIAEGESFYLRVVDLLGRAVLEQTISDYKYSTFPVFIDSPGIYVVEVHVKDVQKTFRVINNGRSD